MSGKIKPSADWGADLSSSIVVFLVALPLCLGIAKASNADPFAGMIAGIVGGLVVGFVSASQVSVSGPAAGLTTLVAAAILELGNNFHHFALVVLLAGLIQLVFGALRLGSIGYFFPNSVIKGMLAAIGIILILKQLAHAFGIDKDPEGDESFLQPDGENTFSEIWHSIHHIDPVATTICLIGLGILLAWDHPRLKKMAFFRLVPGSLVVVALGALINAYLIGAQPTLALTGDHLVNLPLINDFEALKANILLPDFTAIGEGVIWKHAAIIALVASLESLLSLEASERIDPMRRITRPNQELIAQGAGNTISGLLGGLPVTAVIVRTSANVAAGAKSYRSAVLHSVWLLLALLFIPGLLNAIPLSALAAILLLVGWKLTKPSLILSVWKKGWSQFIPFAVTVIAILCTDLLIGVGVGLLVGLVFVLRTNYQSVITIVNDENNYLVRFKKDVSFLNKAAISQQLRDIPDDARVIIDLSRAQFVDNDILETIEEFREGSERIGREVVIKHRTYPVKS